MGVQLPDTAKIAVDPDLMDLGKNSYPYSQSRQPIPPFDMLQSPTSSGSAEWSSSGPCSTALSAEEEVFSTFVISFVACGYLEAALIGPENAGILCVLEAPPVQ
jgi:hypothetical protein